MPSLGPPPFPPFSSFAHHKHPTLAARTRPAVSLPPSLSPSLYLSSPLPVCQPNHPSPIVAASLFSLCRVRPRRDPGTHPPTLEVPANLPPAARSKLQLVHQAPAQPCQTRPSQSATPPNTRSVLSRRHLAGLPWPRLSACFCPWHQHSPGIHPALGTDLLPSVPFLPRARRVRRCPIHCRCSRLSRYPLVLTPPFQRCTSWSSR